MKKILTILAATATMFAFGDDFTVSGTSFESYGDRPFDATKDDSGDQAANTYWFTADTDASNVLSNYVGEAVGTANTPDGVSRPDYFASANNSKYLSVETTGKLYRSLVPNEQNTSFTPVAIPENGIYLDTLVKFTAADSVFGDDALENNVDKIAIEYVEHEPEESGDDAITNFVVRAGFIGGEVFATNYIVALPANFSKDDWHRLTVRTLTNIDGNNRVGFKIYIDENVLSYITNNDKFAMSAGFVDDTHTIFPSAVDSGANKAKLSAVAFSGNGSIDDVVFTATKPNFIANSEAVNVTFSKDSGVTAISVRVGEESAVAVDMTTLTATLPAGTTAFTVTATIDEANGYEFARMTVGDGVYTTNPASITGYAGGEIAITTTRNNFNLFDANGDPISGSYQKLSDALAVQDVAKIKLAYDYTIADWEDNFAGYTISKDVVLDLNGKTINGGSSNGRCLFAVALNYTLTVVNSVNSDNGKIVYGGTAGVFDGNAGDVIVGSSSASDYGPVIDGPADGERGWVSEVYRGKFLASENTGYTEEQVYYPDGFGLTPVLDSGSTATLDGTYWVVTRNGAVGTYSITVTPTENATYSAVYTDSGDAIEPVNNVYTVVSGKTITITATPVSGYEYASQPDGWTLSEGVITKVVNEAVAIPAPTATAVIEYVTLTITSVANCTIVVSNATAEVATGTQFNKADAVQLTVYRTPADGYVLDNCAATETITMDQDQTVTAAVKVSGGYPTYIDTEDADEKAKYDAWKALYGDDTGSAYEDAFLLNCAPANVATEKAAFKFTSISYDTTQSKWVTTTTTQNTNGDDYNGTVVVTRYSDVGCKNASETGNFFKAELK